MRRTTSPTPVRIQFVLCAVVLFSASCGAPRPEFGELPSLIAHAGGIGNHRTYTNSLEALNRSVAEGYPAVEIDFSWTRDDHLVLLHDWVRDVPLLFDRPPGKMSFEEFRSARSPDGLTLLALEDLEPWLEDNPDILVFTDFKERPVEGLKRIADAYPGDLHRIVPQIYRPDELEAVQHLGYETIVWTLYNSDLDDAGVVDFASKNPLFGVTMPIQRAFSSDLPLQLTAADVPVFAHTVNDYPTLLELRKRGVAGVYTDWLSPGDEESASRLEPWTFEESGCEPAEFRTIPFVPSNMAGLQISLVFRNDAPDGEPLHVELRAQDGTAVGTAEIDLEPGVEKGLDVADLFPPSVDHGWVRIETASTVQSFSRWVFRENPASIRKVDATSCSDFIAKGPGAGVSGLLVAVVNPTAATHSYTLRRKIGGDLIDEESVPLDPGHQLIRVYRSRTDKPIEVSIGGGQMVPMVLRWDPLVRFIE